MEQLNKINLAQFIFREFVIFISQITVFFMVAVFTSNFLNSEEKLVAFTEKKINDGSAAELVLTFFAILIVIGFFTTIGKIFDDNKYIDYYVNEVLLEMPKTIYVFGTSVTGAMLAVSLFVYLNPESASSGGNYISISLSFALIMFIYGCALSYGFKRKSLTHLTPSTVKTTTN